MVMNNFRALALGLNLATTMCWGAGASSGADGVTAKRIACDARCFSEIKSALVSSNYQKKTAAMYKLGQIGTPKAVRLLIPILDENSGGYRKGRDLSTPDYSMVAADSLRTALPEVWKRMLRDSNGKGVVPIPAWKAWWKENEVNFGK
jgi:hypothetical protein